MQYTLRLNSLALTAAAFALVAVGCGPGKSLQKAKGQILADGKNYSVGDREQLQIIFYPHVEGGKPANYFMSYANKDGSFETLGMDGNGIPPGKYRVSISSPYGGGKVKIPKELDSPMSPITREIVLGKGTLAPIDIMKPSG